MEIGYPYFAKNFPPKELLRTHSKSDMDGAEGVRVQRQLKPKFFKKDLDGNFDTGMCFSRNHKKWIFHRFQIFKSKYFQKLIQSFRHLV